MSGSRYEPSLFLVLFKDMVNTLLAVKRNMTSTYDARQRRVGATVLEISPNFVLQIKAKDGRDGYNAVQLGIGSKKSVKKPQLGLFKKVGIAQPIRWLKEVRTDKKEDLKPGQLISAVDVFKAGDLVKITSTSKGHGFAGVVKRYNFAGGPKTHGQSDRHRAPGSIGSGTTPGRVYKGKRMAGHMGVAGVSLMGVEVISVDKANNLITVKSGVAGHSGSLVMITKLGKIKGYTPPPEEKPEEGSEHSENSVDQKVSGSESQNSDTSDSSDKSGTPSNSEVSENTKEQAYAS